ncbi:hypothetical protein CEXT_97571, partial [Caerostris extrusa]
RIESTFLVEEEERKIDYFQTNINAENVIDTLNYAFPCKAEIAFTTRSNYFPYKNNLTVLKTRRFCFRSGQLALEQRRGALWEKRNEVISSFLNNFPSHNSLRRKNPFRSKF